MFTDFSHQVHVCCYCVSVVVGAGLTTCTSGAVGASLRGRGYTMAREIDNLGEMH